MGNEQYRHIQNEYFQNQLNDILQSNLTPDNEIFEERKEVPHLKILLFLLKENLGIDINDSNELTIIKGKVDSNMMRNSPYYGVKILSLNRTVLICDQIDNVTFILDNNLLHIQDDELLNLTKDELKNFIEFNKNLGKMIQYSENYIQDIIFALTNKLSQSNTDPETLTDLYPKPIHNILSINGMSTLFGISNSTLSKVIKELQEDLGEVQKYSLGTRITEGYTLEQQEKIRQGLKDKGVFTEKAPENILSITGISTLFGISRPTLSRVIKELQEDLGEVQKYRFGTSITYGYTLEQQEKIRQVLKDKEVFTEKAPEAPENILSIRGMSTLFGISNYNISKVIKELQEDLGEVQRYSFGTKITDGYTLEQQEKIRQGLKDKGVFTEKAPEAPENILSINGMSTLFGISNSTLSKVIKELQEDLGELQKYRFYSKITEGYTLEQQEKIRQGLKDKGVFTEKVPENILSINGMSTLFGISSQTISKVIEELQEDLGEVQKYYFGKVVTYGYTLEQQEKIKQGLDKRVFTEKAPEAPENILSINGMSTLFGISKPTLSKVIKELQEDLGEIQKYRFYSKITYGYTLKQQEKIRQELDKRVFTKKVPKEPENILSIRGMRNLFGISNYNISKVIKELQEDLGEVQKYSLGTRITYGYTLEQQEKIRQGLKDKGVFTEKVPENILSINGMSTLFGISNYNISKVIKELQEDLGEIQKYRFRSKITEGYTLEQQEKIRQGLKDKGVFTEKVPENILSINGMSTLFGISNPTLSKVIEELQEDLGEVQKYRFYSKITEGYTLKQQEKIRQELDKRVFTEKAPEAPKNILSINRISTLFGISRPTLYRVIKELQEDLGEVQKYRFRSKITDGYTLEQQEKIRQGLDKRVFTEKVPENILSINGMQTLFGISSYNISKVIEELQEDLGEVQKYHFYSNITYGYTLEQQEKIRQVLKDKGLFSEKAPEAPENILSIRGMTTSFGTSNYTISKVIKELQEDLGEVQKYYFGTKITYGYTLEQQEKIRQAIQQKNKKNI
jgi:hypothetical protein